MQNVCIKKKRKRWCNCYCECLKERKRFKRYLLKNIFNSRYSLNTCYMGKIEIDIRNTFFEKFDINLALTNIFNWRPIFLSASWMFEELTSRPEPEKYKSYPMRRYLLKFTCSIISDSFSFLLKENRFYILSGYITNISYYWFPLSRAHFVSWSNDWYFLVNGISGVIQDSRSAFLCFEIPMAWIRILRMIREGFSIILRVTVVENRY